MDVGVGAGVGVPEMMPADRYQFIIIIVMTAWCSFAMLIG